MVDGGQRPAVGAAPRRRRLRRGPHRARPAGDRHPAGPAADPADRRAGAAVRGGAARSSSPPTRSCPTCRSRSRCATSRTSTCAAAEEAVARAGAGGARPAGHVPRPRRPADRVCACPTTGAAALGVGEVAAARRCTRRRPTPSGQVRLFAPSVTALEAMLDDVLANRPRFGRAPPPRPAPHVVVVIDGGSTAGSDHLMTEGGVDGVTLIDLSNAAAAHARRRRPWCSTSPPTAPSPAPRWTAPRRSAGPTRCPRAQAEALARELAPLRLSAASYAERRPPTGDTGPGRAAGPRRPVRARPGARLGQPAQPRPAAGADRRRRRRPPDRAGPQGVRAGRHGPARPAGRRDRLRQERAAAYARARAGGHAQPGDPQLRAGRLQGRRHLRRARPAAAHQRGHHQPRARSWRWSTACSARSRAS